MDAARRICDEPPGAALAAACLGSGLLRPGDRVVVAVSGGADSAALALGLREARGWGLPLHMILAHVDHGWRGPGASRADRRAVESLAERLGLPLEVAGAPERPVPTEAAARAWRYDRLLEAARRHRARWIATGHHLRDQAETVRIRSRRGAGPRGRAGIPARREVEGTGVGVVRPLLGVHPARLRDWLRGAGLAWVEDATNGEGTRERAAARRDLVRLGPGEDLVLRRLSLRAAGARRAIEAAEARAAARLDSVLEVFPFGPAARLPRRVLAGLQGLEREAALLRLGRAVGAGRAGPWTTRRHRALLDRLLERGGDLDLPRGPTIRVSGSRVWLWQRAESQDLARPRPVLLRRDLPWGGHDLGPLLGTRRPGEEVVAARALGVGPRLRRVLPGDAFRPLGWPSEGPVSVLALLAKAGFPAPLRARHPVLVRGEDDRVLWVPGRRIDRDLAVGAGTDRVASLRLCWHA
jgi:tRNA(Ile)-lysidine synthetase-like protein